MKQRKQGDLVEVHSFGRWYVGAIIRTTPTRALVRYTAGKGATREKWFGVDRVRDVEVGTRKTCRACEGDGIVEVESRTPHSERVTRDSRRCPHCNGKGWVTQ